MSAMSSRQVSTVSDLVEEGKKRIVLLIVCVVGLSYMMSLTSSSVWVNMPVAASLVLLIRYLVLDYDMRRKAATYKSSKPSPANIFSQKKPNENPKPIVSNWKRKVNSPIVEDAIDHFTQHIVSEWVTDLWYSRITPDKQGPEELVQIINGVLGEISCRARNVNLIDLLTRDIINLFCTHLELFRSTVEKIEERKQHPKSFNFEQRDLQLKAMLAADNKLHPALISPEAEHKVLQHLMEGLIALTFKPKELQCSLLRYITRELLACVVIRPVVNLANPRFINERIESLVISMKKTDKGATAAQVPSQIKSVGPSKTPSDNSSLVTDPSVKGVELVQLKKAEPPKGQVNGTVDSKDPLLSVDPRSTRSWSSFPSNNQGSDKNDVQRNNSGGEWVEVLDMMSRRKTEALAPEHFDNMWTRGRNYKKGVGASQVSETSTKTAAISKAADSAKVVSGQRQMYDEVKAKNLSGNTSQNFIASNPSVLSHVDDEDNFNDSDETESASSGSYLTEDEDETSNVTGLDSPVTKVWDGKSNRNLSVSRIHHPLESFKKSRKTRKGRSQKTQLGRKRSRLSSKSVHMWQEVERTSFLSGDGKDLLQSSKVIAESEEDLVDEKETEQLGRISAADSSVPINHHLVPSAPKNSFLNLSFMKLRCEVQGANIVKSGSRNFAVYSVSVTDANNHSWSIKRRFSHFEELHRRLKEFPEYNLHLPPKHFLSTGLDVPIIQERCKLLDQYLKKLLQFPVISESIEVWDFLSVDSQTYLFSNSISVIETFSVNDHASSPLERNTHSQNNSGSQPFPQRELNSESNAHPSQMKPNNMKDVHSPQKNAVKETRKLLEDSGSDSGVEQKTISRTGYSKMANKERESNDSITSSEKQMAAASDPTLPVEWVPPNLSIPILDLVDVLFQLQDGGWIRRQAFWVAKQVLQLGMGDAFDDWLIEKIKRLRRGSVVAAGIRRIEQILWPDGIFITKHPNRRRPPPADVDSSPSPSSNGLPPSPISQPKKDDAQKWEEQQAIQAEERAKFVYELMIDKAPATVVGLVGRKEYEQSVKDLYYFIQSSVFLKQFALDLVELLLLSAFPEMDYIFKELHEQRATFGKYKPD